jgi:hypothetical protein
MTTPIFRVGDFVTWTSQSQGSTKTKTGKVVANALVANGIRPGDYADLHFPEHRLMFDGWDWETNGVLVEVYDGKTTRAKPKLYMPKVKNLKPIPTIGDE